ncbi:MAG: PHB depolymerase family esterase [Gemmatimonadota bacterium]|nr:PHB depolymerase family esterase [Gemmatimonadota bacterium]
MTCADGAAPPPAAQAAAVARGQCIAGEFTSALGTRRYLLYVPAGFSASDRPALIVMLHGCTQDAADFARGTRMDAAADREGFLVLYPEQPESANPRKCWNWYDTAHQHRDAGEPGLIAGIIEQVARRYAVDADHVYVAGLSAGAAMAAIIAATYPDRVAGVALHSGIPYGGATSVAHALEAMTGAGATPAELARSAMNARGTHKGRVPLIVIQGGADAVVRPTNARRLSEQWSLAGTSESSSLSVTALPPRQIAGHECLVTRFSDGVGRVLVEEWVIGGLAHAWSGGSPLGTFTEPGAPDATAEIVRFFGAQGGLKRRSAADAHPSPSRP